MTGPAAEDGEPTVAQAILRTLAGLGVRTAFGLPGVHNLAFWQESPFPAPGIVGTRHEQTAVYAADGLARATGGLGVALTTTGPGVANAVGAFGEAAASGSPVLLLSSEIATTTARAGVVRGALHESADQAALFAPLAKAVHRPRTARDAVREVARAAATALQWPRGPVYVDVPTDVLSQPAAGEVAVEGPRRTAPAASAVAAAVDLIESHRRAVLWVGGGAVQSDAGQEVVELAERLAAPVVSTWAGRGVVPPDHPCCVDLPPHEPEIAALLRDADLLVAIGTGFDGPGTKNWTLPLPGARVALNADATEATKNYPPDVALVGDARTSLALLNERVGKRTEGLAGRAREVRDAVRRRLRAEPGSEAAGRLVDAVDEAVARHGATVVNDMAIPGYWIGGYGRVDAPRRMQYPVGWGTLGYALPASVGAAAAGGRPVLAVCGDGGIMFALGELAVLAEHRLPVTVLLVADGGYGMLRYDQRRAGDAPRGVDLGMPDFALLAQAFDIGCTTVALEDLAAGLDSALAAREPHMVLLHHAFDPPRTVSARWSD